MSDRPRWLRLLGSGPTEDSTERDGVLSYAGEWHALLIGVGIGFSAVMPVPGLWKVTSRIVGIDADSRTAAIREARAESWYALGGIAIGALLAMASMGVALAFAHAVL